MNNKTLLKVLFPALLLMMACSDYQDDINRQGERLDSLENDLNGIVKQLQSLVFVPEYNNGFIRVDGTTPMTLRYRVEPKKLATALATNSQQLRFDSKTNASSPSLSISNVQGDATAGVITMTATPSSGFEYDGDYAFALVFSDGILSFTSTYTPVFVVTHPTAVDITCANMTDLTQQQMVGTSVQLLASFTPIYTTETNVTWSTSDEAVAQIDNHGMVTFMRSGTVNITVASVDNSEITHSITIKVTGDDFPVDPSENTGQNEAE